jgi:hypothetical protein
MYSVGTYAGPRGHVDTMGCAARRPSLGPIHGCRFLVSGPWAACGKPRGEVIRR